MRYLTLAEVTAVPLAAHLFSRDNLSSQASV